ncbi:MAG: hypothetical protein ABH842_05330 [Candidatus Micrarchaeota archaeon]
MVTNRRLGVGLAVAVGAAAVLGYQAHSTRTELNRFKQAVAVEAIRTAATAKVQFTSGIVMPMVPECLPTEERAEMDMLSLPIVVEKGKAPRIMPEFDGKELTLTVTICGGEDGMAIAVSPPMMDVASNLARISGSKNAIEFVGQTAEELSFPALIPLPDDCLPMMPESNDSPWRANSMKPIGPI